MGEKKTYFERPTTTISNNCPKPKKKRKWWIVIVVLLGIGLIGSMGDSSEDAVKAEETVVEESFAEVVKESIPEVVEEPVEEVAEVEEIIEEN